MNTSFKPTSRAAAPYFGCYTPPRLREPPETTRRNIMESVESKLGYYRRKPIDRLEQ